MLITAQCPAILMAGHCSATLTAARLAAKKMQLYDDCRLCDEPLSLSPLRFIRFRIPHQAKCLIDSPQK
jgi:hypothetical protein